MGPYKHFKGAQNWAATALGPTMVKLLKFYFTRWTLREQLFFA